MDAVRPPKPLNYLFLPRVTAGETAHLPHRWEGMDSVVLTVYAFLLSWGIHHHQPWIDEAQAWLLARDDSISDLLRRRLHYEGAPALWHLLLKGAVALHLPYAGLNWMAGTFALAGIFVLLRFSPFPRLVRWLLPFTFYLQYQYAVVARPYVLFPLLLFTLCIVYTLRRPRPLLFGLVAGLLANINAHAGILGCVFMLLYLADGTRRGAMKTTIARREVVLGTVLFGALCVLRVAVAFPAPDAMVIPTATGHVKQANPLLVRLLPPERMPALAPPLDPSLDEVASLRAQRALPGTPPEAPLTLKQRIHRKLRGTLIVAADVATFPVAESNLLGVVFLLALAAWLWSRGALRYAVPWMIAVPLAAYIWIYDHHTGIRRPFFISNSNDRCQEPSCVHLTSLDDNEPERAQHTSSRRAESTGRRYFAAILVVCTLAYLFPFVAFRSGFEPQWLTSYWGKIIDTSYRDDRQDAAVVLFGDSTAVTNFDPRRLSRDLHLKVIVLPNVSTSLPVTGYAPLRSYLQHNKQPRLIIFYLSGWDLDFLHNPFTQIVEEGEEMLLLHASNRELLRYVRKNPRKILMFPLHFYSFTNRFGDVMHFRPHEMPGLDAGHLLYLPHPTPMKSDCTFNLDRAASGIADASVREGLQEFATPGTRALVFISPIPRCKGLAKVLAIQHPELHLAPVQVLPPADFRDDGWQAHMLTQAIRPSTDSLEPVIRQNLDETAHGQTSK